MKFVNGHNTRVRPEITNEPPFYIDGVACRNLPVDHGHRCVVEASRYLELMQWKWFPRPKDNGVYFFRMLGKHSAGRETQPLHDYILNPPSGYTADHKNGQTWDNRVQNLRPANYQQQMFNKGVMRGKQIPYKGTRISGKGFSASIKLESHGYYLGKYPTNEDAAKAYDRAALMACGEFARLNFPDEIYTLNDREFPSMVDYFRRHPKLLSQYPVVD